MTNQTTDVQEVFNILSGKFLDSHGQPVGEGHTSACSDWCFSKDGTFYHHPQCDRYGDPEQSYSEWQRVGQNTFVLVRRNSQLSSSRLALAHPGVDSSS